MMLATRTGVNQDINAWCSPTGTTATDVIVEAYENAAKYFEKELCYSQRERAWIRGYTSMKDVVQVVSQAQALYDAQSKKTARIRRSVDTMASSILQYASVFDVLAQADPLHAGLAWGAIRFLISGVKAHAEMVGQLSEALSGIGEVVTRVTIELMMYPTSWMQAAVSHVYAHILHFLKKALDWYNTDRLHRYFKSVVNPYQLKFGDTVQGIEKCVAAVDKTAGTASHAEIRGLTLALKAQDQKLHDMQTNMEQGQALNQAMFKQILQLTTNHFDFSRTIKEDTEDMRPRIQDMQFHDILSTLRSIQLPEEVLAICDSYTRRGISWRQPGRDTVLAAQKLKDWVQAPTSSRFIVTAGPRAEPRTKAMAVEVTKMLKDTPYPVFWYLSSPTATLTAPTVGNVLKDLIFQALRHDPSIVSQDPRLGSIQAFQAQHNLAEWTSLAILVLSKMKQFFVIVETDELHRLHDPSIEQSMMDALAHIFDEVVQVGSTMKLLSVSYASRNRMTPQTGQYAPLTAMLNGPLPAVRRKGPIMRQLQVGRGRHQFQPRLAAR